MKFLNSLTFSSSKWSLFPVAASALVPLAYVLFSFGFTVSNLSLPLQGFGDELLYATNVKALMTTWSPINPSFGGFGGQDLNFALVSVDLGAPLIAAVISSLFQATPFFGMNMLFILSYPLTGVVTFESLRRLGGSASTSAIGAILFSTLGFHALWNTASITISNYWYLPACVAVFLSLITGRVGFFDSRTTFLRSLLILGLALFSGMFYSYWAFGLVFAYILWICVAATQKLERNKIVSAIKFTFATISGFAFVSFPSIVANQNSSSAINYLKERHFSAGLSNGSTLTSYFNFPPGSLSERIFSSVFHDYKEKMDFYYSFMVAKGFAGESLGYYQAIPIGLILAMFLIFIARTWFSERSADSLNDRLPVRLLSIAALAFFSLSTIGGLGVLFSMFGSSALRGFGRFYIFVVLAIIFVVVLSTRFINATRKGNALFGLIAILLAFASLENFSNPVQAKATTQRTVEVNIGSDLDAPTQVKSVYIPSMISGIDKLESELESHLGKCTILNLPITHYPYESPGFPTYRLLLPGLISDKFHWTAGAVGGSPAYEKLLPIRKAVDAKSYKVLSIAQRDGYCAVVIDVSAWNSMHYFKPWPEYIGHPVSTISEFISSNPGDWLRVNTVYGDYLVRYLT